MLDAAQDVQNAVRDKSLLDIQDDRMLLMGIVKSIEIIGEAASRIDPAEQTQLPGIPWQSIVGMRNRLVHAYYDIDVEQIWRTSIEDLPDLVRQIEQALIGQDL
jgi:uncharacterized protein with HEPN domain